MLEIFQIPVLDDNYIYILHDQKTKQVAVVDPAVSDAVTTFLDQNNFQLNFILNTHHHFDHVGANLALKNRYHCQILGSDTDKNRIPGIDGCLREGDSVCVGDSRAEVLFVPGHTRGHIAFWFPEDRALFCGDTLFSLGCGRLFEGTAQQMWQSLCKIRELPDETTVYCAHEYTLANGQFAQFLRPSCEALRAYIEKAQAKRDRGEPTIPCNLGQEKLLNPFLRADKNDLKATTDSEAAAAHQVFARIREQKDRFTPSTF